jgi:hypothetical protein
MRLRRSGRIPDCSDSRLDQCGQAGRDETGSLLDSCRTGAQVDEAALVEALRTRRIAGAALDGFEREPLPTESPPWSLRNLLLAPHTAGLTDKLWHRHYELLSDNLRRYLEHKRLPFVVTREKDINCLPCYSFLDTYRALSTDSALHAKCISWNRTSWNRASF